MERLQWTSPCFTVSGDTFLIIITCGKALDGRLLLLEGTLLFEHSHPVTRQKT